MELSQLRYFVRVVKAGSFGRAAVELDVAESAIIEQVSQLERELSTRLLLPADRGVLPTDAGIGFLREAQLTIRHADEAVRATQQPRLQGTVRIGVTPTACSVLGMPLILETRQKYPEVRLHVVESLSGHLATMLKERQLDLAVLYGRHAEAQWTETPLLEERLFLIQSVRHPIIPALADRISLTDLRNVPLILPSARHGLRGALDAAFTRVGVQPSVTAEIDSLSTLMASVDAGLGATVQPWAATTRFPDAASRFALAEITDKEAFRRAYLCSLPNDDLSPAAVAVRILLAVCARELVRAGTWVGARQASS